MEKKSPQIGIEGFYAFRFGAMWSWFRKENFSFIMLCCYLVMEYVRPQVLFPVLLRENAESA